MDGCDRKCPVKAQLKKTSILVFLAVLLFFNNGCNSQSNKTAEIMSGTIKPELFFQTREDDPEYSFPSARDMAFDSEDSFYIFDYFDNTIKKYDSNGEHLKTFGGKGQGAGEFTHLTGIRNVGNRLLAVDSVGLLSFNLDGYFLNKKSFAEEVLTEYPAIFDEGDYVGQQIHAAELKVILTFRSSMGEEYDRLAFYDIREFFPEIDEGEDFFLSSEHARSYRYALNQEENILWAASDEFKIYRYHEGEGKSIVVISEDYSPVPYPAEEKEALLEKKAKIKPPLFLYVPEIYQLIFHLLVGPEGDIWIYLKSLEKTGFLRYSAQGSLKGFYTIDADFDVTEADQIVRIYKNRMYFLVKGRKSLKIYAADLPGKPEI
jgi:hypothetical protein